jgi:hypothetical protein
MKKLYDLTIKTGSYMKDGAEKGRYENVGAVMEKDDGGRFILLKRSFNPAGVPYREGSDSIILSMFKKEADSPSDSESAMSRVTGGPEDKVPDDIEVPF